MAIATPNDNDSHGVNSRKPSTKEGVQARTDNRRYFAKTV
jgi:hypothetical protein